MAVSYDKNIYPFQQICEQLTGRFIYEYAYLFSNFI
jgi:hypothetical protein